MAIRTRLSSAVVLAAVASGVVIAVIVVVLVGSGPSGVDYSGLLFKAGAYALDDPRDADSARAAGLDLALTAASPERDAGFLAHGIHVVDSAPKDLIYAAMCPHGPGSCHRLSPSEDAALTRRIADHVRATASDGAVVGYDLVDDYDTDMRSVLAQAYRTIRSVDPSTPTVCPLALHAAYTNVGNTLASTSARILARFRVALTNYSPRWCDVVGLYTYGPNSLVPVGSPPPPPPAVEWDLHSVLPQALALLRSKGWDSRTQPLMGIPQTFSYLPATGRSPGEDTYWYGPTADQLATEIGAFCDHGARIIVGYAWRDAARGRASELDTSPTFRTGLRDGLAHCRRSWSR